jgi:hypothetical protein
MSDPTQYGRYDEKFIKIYVTMDISQYGPYLSYSHARYDYCPAMINSDKPTEAKQRSEHVQAIVSPSQYPHLATPTLTT